MRSLFLPVCFSVVLCAAVPFDKSGVTSGPVAVSNTADTVRVEWSDQSGRKWNAEFNLEPGRPLITRVGPQGAAAVIERADPIFDCEIGKRRGGWDEFFDFPPSHPEGTRRYAGVFRLTAAKAVSIGDRVQLTFDGLQMGPLTGGVAFTIFPGSRLIQQEAVVSTSEADTAFYYNAGLRTRLPADVGEVMDARISYFDTAGQFQTIRSRGPERTPVKVRHRALALRTTGGSVVAFPAPHQYFMARDFTSNMGFTWHYAWRGVAALGIRQYPDDNSRFYPWMNAPPGTQQRLSLFLLVEDREPRSALDSVLRYTNGDRFPRLDGYRTLASHWHFNYTVQAMQNGPSWTPPFKQVLKDMGVDAALIMDFHGDGHSEGLDDLRLVELEAMQKACRAHSDSDFLIIPGEEANAWLGGHYCLMFPKPVYWFKKRPEGKPLRTSHPKYGTVWYAGSAQDVLEMARAEGGLVYQAHPRTKGSKAYPDKSFDTPHFNDPLFFGVGWKAMPSDLSSPRLAERAFKTIDDINNLGYRKIYMGEADVFQIDSTHELYSHMNVNYVRLPKLPDYDHYGEVVAAASKGQSFITTGEVLLPRAEIKASTGGGIAVTADVRWTFPLRVAEVVWGDGSKTSRKMIPLESTREFGTQTYSWAVDEPSWKWARIAVWDVAGNGAFTQPVWKETRQAGR